MREDRFWKIPIVSPKVYRKNIMNIREDIGYESLISHIVKYYATWYLKPKNG